MKNPDSLFGASSGVVGQPDIFWQYRRNAQPAFDERIFDDEWITKCVDVGNSPSAGRGGSRFLQIDSHKLVLRRYHRGGMARAVSENRYIWLGLKRTRAWREFAILGEIERLGLPAPRPYACQVRRFGSTYAATLITHYVPGITLAEKLCHTALSTSKWQVIGRQIRDFHRAGVYHADLNAHNVLLNWDENVDRDRDSLFVSLIDFDRARIIPTTRRHRFEKNIARLQRSLIKIGGSGPLHYDQACWNALLQGYNANTTHQEN